MCVPHLPVHDGPPRVADTVLAAGALLDGTPYESVTTLYDLLATALPVMNSLNASFRFNLVPGNSKNTRSGAVAAMFDLYDRNQTVAFIGESGSGNTGPMVYAESRFGSWHCSGTASSTAFSEPGEFARFFRTIPDDSQQGVAIARFVRSMGWTKVNLLVSTDSYGGSIATSFSDAARALGVKLSLSDVYSPGDQDLSSQVAKIANSESNIVIFAVSSSDDAVVLLREARRQGLLGPDRVWIGTDALGEYFTSSVFPSSPTHASDTANVQGAMYFMPLVATDSAAYQTMANAWAALGKTTSADSVPYGGLNYDCLLVLARGLIQLATKVGAGNVNAPGLLLVGDFLPPPFDGATGSLAFTSTGDRLGDFSVLNIYNGDKRVAFNVYSNGTVSTVHPPQFYSGSSTPPVDVPPKSVQYPTWGDSFVVTTSVVRALLMLALVGGTVVLTVNRHKSTVKHLSFPFLVLITVGCELVLASGFFEIGEPSRTACIAPVWTLTVGAQLVLASAGVKTYRLWKIFDNSSLRKRLKAIDNHYLVRFVGLLIAVQSTIYAIWLGAFPSEPVAMSSRLFLCYSCQSPNLAGIRAVTVVSVAINVVLLLAVMFLAYKTRNVVSAFRETTWIMYSNIGIVGSIILTFALVTFRDFSLGAYYLRSILLLYVVTFTYVALVGRVVVSLLRGQGSHDTATVRRALKSHIHGRTSSVGNGTGAGGGVTTARGTPAAPTKHGGPHAAAVGKLSGRFPVKSTTTWFATWTMHAVTLNPGDGYLVLQPDPDDQSDAGELGTALRLTAAGAVQFDADPRQHPLCLHLFARGNAWLVQFESDADRDAWVRALAGIRTVRMLSRTRSGTQLSRDPGGRPAGVTASGDGTNL
ncbi:hypothetical protein GGF31_002064 [Allomyces arbusculus]|nr:hypothetical protein GGF31_002064 [Allomyces arbusculus]